MRILHTEASCGWGGQEIRILSEARGMLERGHEVHLVCPPSARIFSEAPRFGVPVEALSIERKGLTGLRAMRTFLSGRGQRRFDIVNCHSSTDSWLAALALVGRAGRPALVRTRHVSAPVARNLTTRWLYRAASAMVVTTGEALRCELIERNGLDAARVVSVPTGIDMGQYAPPTELQRAAARSLMGVDAGTFVIGIVATLRSWKGHRYLVDALRHLDHTVHPVRLVIVGDGPQRKLLEQQVADLDLQDVVDFRGNQNDVTAYLHGFDVFALPSYANEGVPQAILQAMACAVPVVTTDAGAIGEVARDQDTALVVARQDAQALALALDLVRSHPGEARERARRGLYNVRARHSLDGMLVQMEQVFEQALQRRAGLSGEH